MVMSDNEALNECVRLLRILVRVQLNNSMPDDSWLSKQEADTIKTSVK